MTCALPYVVMIRCPEADKSVSTGLRCDLRTFMNLVDQETLRCPECGQMHAWSRSDAWLRDAAYATGELSVSAVPRS
jgi:hypothetical protein